MSGGVRLAEEAAVLSDYLLAHVEVSAAGATCAGELEPGTDVTSEGATLVFDCGGPVAVADVRISTLTDLDPAYRTLAEGPGGQRQSYSLDRDSFAWELPAPTAGRSPGSLEPPGSSGRSAAVQLGAITAVGVAIGAGAWIVLLTTAGYLLGDNWEKAESWMGPLKYAAVALILGGIVYLAFRWLRNRDPRAAAE